MPAHVPLESLVEYTLLRQLGERMAMRRKQQGLSTRALSARLGIARNTLAAAEQGDPSVTMGTYIRVLGALGCAADLVLVAANSAATSE